MQGEMRHPRIQCELENKMYFPKCCSVGWFMRFEVLTAAKMSMLFFWVVTPCELKIEAVCSSETLVSTCGFTGRYKPKDQYRHELILIR
jgi:hypothetical protein